MFFMRSVSFSFSSLRADASSWRSPIRYFWPSDLTLNSKIPVMAKNWMKLSLCFIAFLKKPRDLLGFGTPGAELGGAEEAMDEADRPQLKQVRAMVCVFSGRFCWTEKRREDFVFCHVINLRVQLVNLGSRESGTREKEKTMQRWY